MSDDRYLTVEEAARAAHCEHRTIRRAIHAGDLVALFSGRWLIDSDDLHDWLRQRGASRLGGPIRQRRRARPGRRPDAEQAGSVARLRAMGDQ